MFVIRIVSLLLLLLACSLVRMERPTLPRFRLWHAPVSFTIVAAVRPREKKKRTLPACMNVFVQGTGGSIITVVERIIYRLFFLSRGTKAELELELPMVQVVQVGRARQRYVIHRLFARTARQQSFRKKKILIQMYLRL